MDLESKNAQLKKNTKSEFIAIDAQIIESKKKLNNQDYCWLAN